MCLVRLRNQYRSREATIVLYRGHPASAEEHVTTTKHPEDEADRPPAPADRKPADPAPLHQEPAPGASRRLLELLISWAAQSPKARRVLRSDPGQNDERNHKRLYDS
jgi:hypothetical protein